MLVISTPRLKEVIDMKEITCFGCTKLSTNICGMCGKFETASAIQWRKYPDNRCTQGKFTNIPQISKKQVLERNIFIDALGRYQVSVNGVFLGSYNTKIEAKIVRNREEKKLKDKKE